MEETKKYLLEFFNIMGMELNDTQVDKWYNALKERIDEREKQ